MRRLSLFLIPIALLGLVGLSTTSAGLATDAPSAVEYGKKAKKKAKKARKKAKRAIRNGQFIGQRGDGQYVDWTFCRNGKYELRTTSGSGTGIAKGKGWAVSIAKKTKRGFWAIVTGKGGLSVAMAKYGKQWKVGIEYFDKPSQLGNVDRSNAKSRCASL